MPIFVDVNTIKLDEMIARARPKVTSLLLTYGWGCAVEASANAPVDTGALRRSILEQSHLETEFEYDIQDGVPYGFYQELGTSKMAAHPFLIPAVEVWWPKFLGACGYVFT